MLNYLNEEQKPLYKAAIDSLAKQRKLRPVFVERKPRPERHAWMHEALGRKINETVSAQLLQVWLVGAQSKLLCDFLDGLGIKHEEDGTVEQLPGAPEISKIQQVVETLLGKYEAELVAVYLNAFQALGETGWDTLQQVLDTDPRLRLQAAA